MKIIHSTRTFSLLDLHQAIHNFYNHIPKFLKSLFIF